MGSYPEHEKMAEVKEDSQRLGEFLNWAEGQGYTFAKWEETDHYRRRKTEAKDDEGGVEDAEYIHVDELVPVHKTVTQWLAEFYAIDLNKIEEEKRAMLEEIRAANEAARA